MRVIEFLRAMESWYEEAPERPQLTLSEDWQEKGVTSVDAYISDTGGVSLMKTFLSHQPSDESGHVWFAELTRDEALKLSEWIRDVYAD